MSVDIQGKYLAFFLKKNLLKPFESTRDQYNQKTMNYIGALQNIQSAMELQPGVTGVVRYFKDISGKLLINMIRKLVQNIGAFKLQYNWSTAGGADIPETICAFPKISARRVIADRICL